MAKSKAEQMREDMSNPDPGITPGDPVTPDVGNAAAVRNGELSASQMGDGHIEGTDIQWPPGRVETAGPIGVGEKEQVEYDLVEAPGGLAAVPVEDDSNRPEGEPF